MEIRMDKNGIYIISIKSILIDEGIFEKFNRFDFIVRLLAIQDYHNGVNDGILMYENMQKERNNEKNFLNIKYDKAWIKFKTLIDGFENGVYNYAYPIQFNRYGRLINGAHRMAIAIYQKMQYISYNYSNIEFEYNDTCNYGIEWFEKYNFNLERILDRYQTLKREVCEEIYGIVWGPAISYADSTIIFVLQKIFQLYDIEMKKREFQSEKEYVRFIKMIYRNDSMRKERLEKKIRDIVEVSKKKEIVMIKILVPFKERKVYEEYMINKNKELEIIKEAKRKVREALSKMIDNYRFDNVFHCGTSYLENAYLKVCYDESVIETV